MSWITTLLQATGTTSYGVVVGVLHFSVCGDITSSSAPVVFVIEKFGLLPTILKIVCSIHVFLDSLIDDASLEELFALIPSLLLR